MLYNINMKIISRQEAIQNNLKRYFTGLPCKYNHIAQRLLSNRTCIECLNIFKKDWANKPNIKEKSLKRLNNHNKLHPEMHLARTRKRQLAKLNRIPKWLTESDWLNIKCKYSVANMLSRESGKKYHVDHIIPLQGKLVSGLHVPSNIQVILATENVKKSNKHVL